MDQMIAEHCQFCCFYLNCKGAKLFVCMYVRKYVSMQVCMHASM